MIGGVIAIWVRDVLEPRVEDELMKINVEGKVLVVSLDVGRSHGGRCRWQADQRVGRRSGPLGKQSHRSLDEREMLTLFGVKKGVLWTMLWQREKESR